MVSVEKYPCFCGAGLRRFVSKDGRGFLKCKDEMCTLFNPGRPYFRCEETDADDKCDFFQWTDGKTKVKKSMKKKKRDLKRLQKRTSAVEKPKKVMKRIKPLQSSDEEK